jgi:SPP1 gp7 family putative phage head morphogenesis protein
MPVPVPPRLSLGAAEPADAIAAFAARGLLQPSFRWQDVWEQEHASRFAVAGVAQLDVLRLFQEALQQPLQQGKSLADFAKEVKPKLVAKGWWGDVEITDPKTGELRTTRFDDARLQLIYDVNLRQSYAAGRWANMQRNSKRLPLVMYRTMRDERVRASHARWDGVALPIDHPFWDAHYPPNGWRCRCTAFALSEKDLQRRVAAGERITTAAPPDQQVQFTDPRTGATTAGPLGVDPGFAFNPGKQIHAAQSSRLLRNALDAAEPSIAEAQIQQALSGENFGRFVRRPVPGEEFPVGLLHAAQARLLQETSRTVAVTGPALKIQLAVAGAKEALPATAYLAVQDALREGAQVAEAGALWFLLERGGILTAAQVLAGANGPVLGQLLQLSEALASESELVQRLRRAAAKQAQGAARG